MLSGSAVSSTPPGVHVSSTGGERRRGPRQRSIDGLGGAWLAARSRRRPGLATTVPRRVARISPACPRVAPGTWRWRRPGLRRPAGGPAVRFSRVSSDRAARASHGHRGPSGSPDVALPSARRPIRGVRHASPRSRRSTGRRPTAAGRGVRCAPGRRRHHDVAVAGRHHHAAHQGSEAATATVAASSPRRAWRRASGFMHAVRSRLGMSTSTRPAGARTTSGRRLYAA